MKTYKELRDKLFEEVGKIDVSNLSLASYGSSFKEYAELLKSMADVPSMSQEEKLKERGIDSYCCEINGPSVPKIDEGGKNNEQM